MRRYRSNPRISGIHGTPSQSKVAQQVATTVPDSVKSLNVVYFPQLGEAMAVFRDMPGTTSFTGFLICIPMLDEWSEEDQVNHLDGWTFQVRDLYHSSVLLKYFPAVLFRVGRVYIWLDIANAHGIVPTCISSLNR